VITRRCGFQCESSSGIQKQCVRVHMSYLDNGRRFFHIECTRVRVSLETEFHADVSNRACPDGVTSAF
jgi:hypothetical protein